MKQLVSNSAQRFHIELVDTSILFVSYMKQLKLSAYRVNKFEVSLRSEYLESLCKS
jgi:hypothetical protein